MTLWNKIKALFGKNPEIELVKAERDAARKALALKYNAIRFDPKSTYALCVEEASEAQIDEITMALNQIPVAERPRILVSAAPIKVLF